MDETYKVAVTRLGDRIRVGGTAEIAGYNLRLRDGRRATRSITSSPISSRAAATSAEAEFWTGLRPMTPDGTPIIGPTRYPQSLAHHRPRHARLDHGGRLRPRDGRPDLRAQAGDQP